MIPPELKEFLAANGVNPDDVMKASITVTANAVDVKVLLRPKAEWVNVEVTLPEEK